MNVTDSGREELRRVYRNANTMDHCHPSIELDTGRHVVCEVFDGGAEVYIESVNGMDATLINTDRASEDEFMSEAISVIEG